jgi:hypothetical protein
MVEYMGNPLACSNRREVVKKTGLGFEISLQKTVCSTEWTENQIQVAFGNSCK